MYLVRWREKVDGKVVFISQLKRNQIQWDYANRAKTFSSPEEFIEMFNNVFNGGKIERYNSESYWGRHTKIVYIHPSNIPGENEQWID